MCCLLKQLLFPQTLLGWGELHQLLLIQKAVLDAFVRLVQFCLLFSFLPDGLIYLKCNLFNDQDLEYPCVQVWVYVYMCVCVCFMRGCFCTKTEYLPVASNGRHGHMKNWVTMDPSLAVSPSVSLAHIKHAQNCVSNYTAKWYDEAFSLFIS